MDSLKGKVALITGASKGIGRATARRLAEGGANIVIGATRMDLLDTLVKDVKESGVKALAAKCDVTELSDCRNLVQQALAEFGQINILVNNAGVGFSGKVIDSIPEEIEHMIKVNILGVYYMTRSVLPSMIEQEGGDIINIASVAGLKYSPNFAMYSATKFAVRAFSEGLRNEVQAHNIRVTLIHPGMTQTHFFDLFSKGGLSVPMDKGDILNPEVIADTIYFALSQPTGVALNELTVRPSWQER
ncbi:MAG: SDR family oxidoreductase [Planctomycetota bacterium]|jgi:NADP-dependent 3-hydroxy acid dehydrogenase YdfG